MIQGLYSQHFIFLVTYKGAQYARVFVPGRLFQPSIMFASKAGAYLSETSFTCSILVWANGLTHKQ